MTEEYIQICFGIISQVGVARSLYVEAVRKARAGEFDAIEGLQKEANELFVAAQNVHLKLLQQEAAERGHYEKTEDTSGADHGA